MNLDRIEGNWKQMTGKLNEQWGKLTDGRDQWQSRAARGQDPGALWICQGLDAQRSRRLVIAAGDIVEAENCYQHAEHYFRVTRER